MRDWIRPRPKKSAPLKTLKGTGATAPTPHRTSCLAPCGSYLMVKYQLLAPTLPAASRATIFTTFLPLVSLGEV